VCQRSGGSWEISTLLQIISFLFVNTKVAASYTLVHSRSGAVLFMMEDFWVLIKVTLPNFLEPNTDYCRMV
jgi:hypothetical protein